MMGRELCAIADLRLAQTPAGHYRPRIKPATSPSCTLLHRHHHQGHYHHQAIAIAFGRLDLGLIDGP